MNIRKFTSALLLAAVLGLSSLPALAQELIGGTVYQIDNSGVCIQNTEGMTYVRSATATFRRGLVVYGLGDLGVGMDVVATCNPSYTPQYIPAQYYTLHTDWDWAHQLSGWQRDRIYWHNDNGDWRR